MKTFHISMPVAGRKTVALLCYPYDPKTQRTRATYLGSFSIDADPSQIPADGAIAAGGSAYGVRLVPYRQFEGGPFELSAPELQRIKGWLEDHGTFVPRQRADQAKRAAAEALAHQKQLTLERELEKSIRARVETEVRAEIAAAAQRSEGGWFDRLEVAFRDANTELVAEAARLRARGIELSALRRRGSELAVPANELDELQAMASTIRIDLHKQFEDACKRARLMTQRRTRAAGAQ
ncbi:hypothetical protein [Paucibacter soli]|uniref:hypothetical protein n=1 Tax=Paucibacter soli TaxID=3133433 RepID=UPI00309B3187